MSVTVRFSMLGLDRRLDEEELVDPTPHRDALAKRNRSGVVTITSPAQPTVELEDEVWHQLLELCNGCVATLAGRGATVRYFEMFGGYELRPGDGVAVLSGDSDGAGAELPTVRYVIRELAGAVAGCTERFVDFLVRLADPDLMAVRDLILPALAALRTALAAP
jgi:hypothetical protein